MKKSIISILCVVLIFIPTFIAVVSYIATQNSPISNNFVEKIDISDLNGKTSTVIKTNKSEDLVSFFVSMNEAAEDVAELPDPLQGTEFYKVTFHSGNVSEEYKYYLNIKGDLCYCVRPDGSVCRLADADVKKFLLTPYALSLFEDVGLPILTSSSNESIVPASVTWKYKIGTSDFFDVTGFETTKEVLSYTMDGGINLSFPIAPDLYTVKIYDSKSQLAYDGTTTDLSNIFLESGDDFTFMLTASWYQDEAREYYGEATYNFKTHLVAGAEFYLGEASVLPGEFVSITGYNVGDVSKITFKSEPSIEFTPTFYKNGDKAIALIPIDANLENKSYVFTVSYGSVSQEMHLEIEDKTFKKRTHNISEMIVKNTRSEAALASFNDTFNEICANSEQEMYFSGVFTDYSMKDSLNASLLAGFGIYRTISSTNETYRSIGVDFGVKAGTKIPACNNGKVVYTGLTTHGGRMVVVDHGLGLKTWYLHLGEVSVAVGDMVKTGDTLGLAGNTGFTETNGVFTIMTIGNMPVCPYSTWENGVILYTK